MKKKKGGGKREPGTEVLSKQDQDDDGAGHLSETLLEVKSSASELPVTTDNSISIQEGLSLNSDVNLLGSLASSDNKIVHPKSEECENAQGQGNIQFSEIPQESESILHSEVSKDKKGLVSNYAGLEEIFFFQVQETSETKKTNVFSLTDSSTSENTHS